MVNEYLLACGCAGAYLPSLANFADENPELCSGSVKVFDHRGKRAVMCVIGETAFVFTRGTRVARVVDLLADVRFMFPRRGRHRGFAGGADDLIEAGLFESLDGLGVKSVWWCGHSLGGGISTELCCRSINRLDRSVVHNLFTIGCPRVGTVRYVERMERRMKSQRGRVVRIVNRSDIVSRVPPAVPDWQLMPLPAYRHLGGVALLTAGDDWAELIPNSKFDERVFTRLLREIRHPFSPLGDHSSDEYCRLLKMWVDQREADQTDTLVSVDLRTPAAEAG